MKRAIITSLLFLNSSLVFAKNDVLTIENIVPHSVQLAFPNDKNIVPEVSDFKVDNIVLMSNEDGERYAVVTFTNMSSGSRTISKDHVMALLANGERIFPETLSHSFKGNESVSLTVSFGKNKFPILSVYTRS